jgi:hypothetical protein
VTDAKAVTDRHGRGGRREVRDAGDRGASRLKSDVAAAKEDEIANDLDSHEDESDKEWTPSSITATNRGYITGTRLVGGESSRVNKGRMSSLTLHHVYDHQTGSRSWSRYNQYVGIKTSVFGK